ncbi:MAG: O-antigen ligase family protein [Candidatus Eisenbacteria sp.]|nr:O-antigen ligase family protein [Candidatus Eisenbacteria bacterium]
MSPEKPAPRPPTALTSRPELGSNVPHEVALGRRIAYLLAAVVLCSAAGLGLVRIEPLLLVGLAAGLLFAVMILTRPFWGLLLYTGLFLLRPAELYPALAPLHLERLVGAATLLGLLLAQYGRERRISVDGSAQTLLLLLFVAASLLSVPFAYWRGQAVTSFLEMLKIVVFYLLVVHLVDSRLRLRVFIWTLLLLIGYVALNAFGGYLGGSTHFAQGIERAVGSTSVAGSPNQLGTTMAAAIPLFLLLALHKPLGWKRLVLAIGTLLLTATLGVTGSRASILGFLGGIAVLWWSTRHRVLLGIVGILVLVGGFLLLPQQYQTRYSTITHSELDGSSQARLATWQAGLQMITDRPIFGVGIGCFGTAHATAYSPEERRSWLEPHSLFIQVFAEVGLVGAVLFFAFLIAAFRLNRRTGRRLAEAGAGWGFERILLLGLFAGLAVLLISGIFGHSLLRRTWYIYAGTGLAVLRIYSRDRETGEQE